MSENTALAVRKPLKKPTPRIKRLCRKDEEVEFVTKYDNFARPVPPLWKRQKNSGYTSGSVGLRRCSSLVTLSPNGKTTDSRIRDMNCSVKSSDSQNDQEISTRQDKLAWRVFYILARNVSRRRNQQINQLHQQVAKANDSTLKLNIQVSLLKSLIKSDEVKREAWKKRLQDERIMLENAVLDNNKLEKEVTDLTEILEKMKETINDLETDNKNYKNTQIFLKSECAAFENQLKKERDANSLIRYESNLQTKKLIKEIDKKTQENQTLTDQLKQLQANLAAKTFALAESDSNLQNATRLWQNSVKEIQNLNKESHDLRKVNKSQQNDLVALKTSMSLLEDNQEQIYKYLNLSVD